MSTVTRFTLTEYDRMIDSGVFEERGDQRLELIFGKIRAMNPAGPIHEDVLDLLTEWSFGSTNRREVRIRVQNSIGVAELDSAPQPDIAWVRAQSYRAGRPTPADVLLIIEVSDSSLASDRGDKLSLYSQAGVRDYWIVNVKSQSIEVYREPTDDGFARKETFGIDDAVRPLCQNQAELPVRRLFPE